MASTAGVSGAERLNQTPHQAAGAGLTVPAEDAATLHGRVQHSNVSSPERWILPGQGHLS